MQKLVSTAPDEHSDSVYISDIPGGPDAFEICVKFCYGMTVTLNAHNVVVVRCAAEYLGMHETIEKGNLIYKIDVFLSSSIFRSWKDSIIVLETTNSLTSMPKELKLVGCCVESIATKACVDVSKVDWSYSYYRKKLPDENGNNDPNWNGVIKRSVPKDWWVEDLCELEIDLYKLVLATIKSKAIVSNEVIGEALKAYAYRRLPGFSKGMIQCGDMVKHQTTVDAIVWLLPAEKGSVSCSFLLRLLKAANLVGSGDVVKEELVKRIGQQLEEASVNDILIRAAEEETMMYDVNVVQRIVEASLRQDLNIEIESLEDDDQLQKMRPGILSDASKLMVAKLIDGYLAEIAKDPNLPLSKFVDLAEMVSGISRPAHDGIYRAIDMYLKVRASKNVP